MKIHQNRLNINILKFFFFKRMLLAIFYLTIIYIFHLYVLQKHFYNVNGFLKFKFWTLNVLIIHFHFINFLFEKKVT
jgi:hypothetical protein